MENKINQKSKVFKLLFGGYENPNIKDTGILIARVIFGLGMLLHGMAKISIPFNWMGDALPSWVQFIVASFEVIAGITLIVGLTVRFMSFSVVIIMLGAIVFAHIPSADPFYRITVTGPNEGVGRAFLGLPSWFAIADGKSAFGSGSAELAILYLVLGVCLFCVGGGKYSIDQWIYYRMKK